MDRKVYDSREKFRCVLLWVFDPTYQYQKLIDDLLSKGLDLKQATAVAGPKPSALPDTEMIQRGIDYTFDAGRRGRYPENRFNTKEIAALYTADSPETSISERRYHWFPAAGQDPSFAVFTVKYTGEARDLRPAFVSGRLPFPEDYLECQKYAKETVEKGLSGLVAPSKRRATGSCCVLFRADGIDTGFVIEEGDFA